MALTQIPEEWRRKVCAILTEARGKREIFWTDDARKRYGADGAAAKKVRQGCYEAVWEYEALDAFYDFLSTGQPMGCQVTMARPPGECYEFFFQFYGERFYGKILLRADRRQVVIFSAHKPLKPSLSCE